MHGVYTFNKSVVIFFQGFDKSCYLQQIQDVDLCYFWENYCMSNTRFVHPTSTVFKLELFHFAGRA